MRTPIGPVALSVVSVVMLAWASHGCGSDSSDSKDSSNDTENSGGNTGSVIQLTGGKVGSGGTASTSGRLTGGAVGSGGTRVTGGAAGRGGTTISGGRAGVGGSTGGRGSGGATASPQDTCVTTLNQLRESVGAPSLTRATSEEACADGLAASVAQNQDVSPADCAGWAITMCPNWPGAPSTTVVRCLNQSWNDAQSQQYMSDTTYTQVACGFYVDASGRVSAVQVFM